MYNIYLVALIIMKNLYLTSAKFRKNTVIMNTL